MLRITPRMIVVLLCGTMLAGCATAHPDVAKLTGGNTAAGHAQKEAAAIDKTQPTDLEGGVRQAKLMRQGGHYDDAIHTLSQLMLVASDDPRVVSEYGKTLAEKGRAQDAVEFLNRALELTGNDWTLYSALGVSYDQLGNQVSARAAYEHALALRPEEPSVLNNYALSRMLAGDTDGAHILIARAQAAGGGSDVKIASNIALLNKIAPAPVALAVAQKPAAMPAQPPAPMVASASPPAMSRPAPPRPAPQPMPMRVPVAQNAPRPIVPAMPQRVAMAPNNGVVMQAVPFDPLAGPVKPVVHEARPTKTDTAKTDTANLVPPKFDIIPDVPATPTAPAKPAAVKTADAKPVKAVPVKAAAKDQIPALRLSANAY
jgi:Flp pilus assembly protein TadD